MKQRNAISNMYNRQAKETNVIFVIINVLKQDNSNADLKMIKFM